MNSGPDANDYGAASILTNMNNEPDANMNKGHNDDIYHAATALTRIRTEKGGKSKKNNSKKNRKSKKEQKVKEEQEIKNTRINLRYNYPHSYNSN